MNWKSVIARGRDASTPAVACVRENDAKRTGSVYVVVPRRSLKTWLLAWR
ncbi:hypothetical protein [Agrobacterium tumefaciens]|nr:hypothetical protein [Agrobacterium tumefaciens]MBD3695525.1 hypothetical protein [Klebsiella pneumoniae]UXS00162.1 hypothetical protein FY156_00980 [Agrobacterium tumefaciens]